MFSDKQNNKIKKYYNIFTGKEVNNYFEALGYEYHVDANKKIYTKLNNEEKEFDYKTNIEFCFKDLKFIICQDNSRGLIILFNISMENNIENQLRESFAKEWKYYKSAYFIDANGSNFKWSNNNFYIEIK